MASSQLARSLSLLRHSSASSARARAINPGGRATSGGSSAGVRSLPVQCLSSSHRTPESNDRSCDARKEHGLDIDAEWQAVRARLSNLETSQPCASERSMPMDAARAAAAEDAKSMLEDSWDVADDTYTPFPSNLPVTEAHPPSPFAQRTAEGWPSWRARTGSLPTVAPSLWTALDQVYVILFGVGQADTEGIYSLRAAANEDGLPQDTIIAFEHAEDAERYAGLLEATMDHTPNVCPIEPGELLQFCGDSGYGCRLEARGSLLIPPDFNVGVTDWERSLRLREGQWSVLEVDPAQLQQQASADAARTALAVPSLQNGILQNDARTIPFHDSDIEAVRAQLERLMAQE